ncbi:GTPase Era [Rhodovibrio salinarum]|uniref:GTPase Era n=1 Tax=Rhodovibrio salinarum TaxID=1087 RepID=A0A934QJ67_9PROT|nr:GTPase Era [Rhodovibrio salinarum]MBK1698003.1 GTPase Era [Rhodovibrio salinarum]
MTDQPIPPGDGESAPTPRQGRCGVVALVGAPNAGKSTLMNRMVGAKLSIVTHKVQTTRTRVRGVAVEGDSQVVFVDTPGVFTSPKRRLERAMVASAWQGADDADVVVLLYDVARKGIDEDTLRIVRRLNDLSTPMVLALNKIDRIKREKLLEIAARFNQEGTFQQTFMISAETGDGVDDLRSYLAGQVPEGPWLFPEDQLSDLPMRLIAAEITREKLFLRLHEELPYALTVETEDWQSFDDGSVRIEQAIYVEREAQKKIALGRQGSNIRKVREAAQADLAEQLGQPVHLFLFVKVREGWTDDPERYAPWGLDFNA